jgi:hypothetical protein
LFPKKGEIRYLYALIKVNAKIERSLFIMIDSDSSAFHFLKNQKKL